MTKHWMQVEEGRKGPALCAPSLSKTSHPQTYRTFSAYYYFLAVWCPLLECRHPSGRFFLWQMQTFAQMGRDPSRAPSNFFITETEGSKSPKMRRIYVKPRTENMK